MNLVVARQHPPQPLEPSRGEFADVAEPGLGLTLHATVADAFAVMNHAAGSPAEEAFLCSRTWECTGFANIHPTDLGYRALAVALLHALN